MTSVTPAVVSPAETVAASLCWLARFKLGLTLPKGDGPARIASKVESYWHDKPCRYCNTPSAELMAQINRANHDLEDEKGHPVAALEAFKRLPPKARTAKVREAQEGAWYDEITRAG